MTIFAKLNPANTDAQLLYKCPAGQNVFLSVSAMNRDKTSTPEASIYLVSDKDLAVDTITINNPGTGITTAVSSISMTGGSPVTPAVLSVASYRLTEASINNGGTGYAVGDRLRLTFTGATVVTNCDVSVTSVGAGGVITGLKVETGVVSVLPTNIVPTVTKVTGTGANATVTGVKFGINAVSVSSPGNGYKEVPSIAFSNVTGATATVNMTQIPEDDDLIEVGVTLPYGKSPLIRDRLRLSPGQSVFVKSSAANAINFHAYGVPTPV